MPSDCVETISVFLKAGPPGLKRLKEVHKNIKRELCNDDQQAWGLACRQSFLEMSCSNPPRWSFMEAVGWDLQRLCVDDLYVEPPM